MKYKLLIRRINNRDIGADCPRMPEVSDFEMYLRNYVDAINLSEIVKSAEVLDGSVVIKASKDTLLTELRQVLLAAQDVFWTQLRIEGISKIV